jgi:hypothetical protein
MPPAAEPSMTSTATAPVKPGGAPRRRRRRWLVLVALLILVILIVLHHFRLRPGHELHGTIAAAGGQSVLTSWLQNAEPAAWDAADNRIIISRRRPNGLWSVYTIRPDGLDEQCITCRVPSFPGVGAATNRGAFDVSPNGRYVLITVEKGSHPGTIGATGTLPGKGVFNDIWLVTIKGTHAWRLTDIPTSPNDGIIWPRFDRTGTQVVWSQMHQGPDLSHPLGQWAMKVARLQWTAGTPHLVDLRTYDPEPGRFFEPYEFSPNDQRILFASDIHVPSGFLSPTAFNSQIWTIDAAHLDDLRRVSPPDPIHGMFSDYNEFAFYIPGTDRILFARTFEATAHGLDYWTVDSNGADPRRVTFMNEPGNPEYLGYSQALGLAFDPHDPRLIVTGLSHELGTKSVQAVFIKLGANVLR